MKRIIFVDDEPRLLEGLQRLLRPQRGQWEMVFVGSGEAALEELARCDFDVIVTDMRMPGMDGAALLRRVQERFPNVVRLVLSGYTELEAVMRSVPVAHQFLTKPCEAEKLREVIDRSCNLQALLSDQAIRRTIGELRELPSQPQVYTELLRALSDPNVSVAVLARIVERDVGISAKILQLVNSSFFGLARHVTSLQNAVSLLGVNMIKSLTLSVEVFRAFESSVPIQGFSFEGLQAHAFLTASIAKRLLHDKYQCNDAFVAGLLHDVGKLILATCLRDLFQQAVEESRAGGLLLHEVERSILGHTHAEIGAYLLGLWGLPYPVVEAVANHHDPTRVAQPRMDVLAAVHLANLLAHEREAPGDEEAPGPREEIDPSYLERLGVSSQLPAWRSMAEAQAHAAVQA